MFSVLNSSLGLFEAIIPLFISAATSRIQQYLPVVHIPDSIKQQAIIREVKRLETVLAFEGASKNQKNSFFILVFTNANALSLQCSAFYNLWTFEQLH